MSTFERDRMAASLTLAVGSKCFRIRNLWSLQVLFFFLRSFNPRLEFPNVPVTKMRSPGLAPLRVKILFASPITAIFMKKHFGEDTVSPPASSTWNWLHISLKPEYSLSRNETEIFFETPSVTSALFGVPPIAAMSLRLTDKDFRPSALGGVVESLKWISSTKASVEINSFLLELTWYAAQSSPILWIESGARNSKCEERRLMSPNSPSSFF